MPNLLAGRRVARIVAPLILLLAIAGCGGDDGGGGSGTAPPVMTYGLAGTVAHHDAGSLSISDGNETVTVAQGASSFAFTKAIANGSAYAVTVASQPPGENCVITNASGTISGAAVTNVAIVCNTSVSQPLALGVSASGSLNAEGSRIFLPVSQVGTVSTTINAVLDTGSAGTLLRASDVFPKSIVTTSGFVFNGQTSITYNGVTVTNVVATRTYGTQSDRVTEQTGNLGFAQVTFGSDAHATTAVMPILFVYQTKANGAVVETTNFANLIGVNPAISPINVAGTLPPSTPTPCAAQSTATCGLASPFRYLSYGSGVDKGFVLNKVTFAPCDIMTPGACRLSPFLTLGVTADIAAGFSTVTLSSCNPAVLVGTSSELLCSQVIPSVMVSSGNAAFTGPAIFDSGAPTTRLSVPADMAFPDTLPMGSIVRIAPTSGFAYQYATGTGYLATTIARSMNAGDYTNSGIGFFAVNSLLVDYSSIKEGWRNGS